MQITSSYKEFIFLNARPALIPSVKQVLDYLHQKLDGYVHMHDIYFKTKAVITELLTNAHKHAGTETVNIQLEIEGDNIIIRKKDLGLPFSITMNAIPGIKKLLAYDVMHQLFAINEGNNRIRFTAEDSMNEHPDINEISEHFGLLIICKCAEEFVYQYDPKTRLNCFIVKMKLLPEDN